MRPGYIFYILLFISTFGIAQQDLKLIPKDFPKFGITVSLPQDWNYVEGSENMKNKLFKSFYREPDNKTPYNTVGVSISYEILKTQVPADTLFEHLAKALKNQVSNKEVIEYIVDKVQGRPTKAFQYKLSLNEFNLTSISTYFIEQNVLFTYHATVFTDKLDAYQSVINKIRQSIQIGNIDPSLLTNSYDLKKIETRYINNKDGFAIDFPIGWYYLEGIMGNSVQIKKANQDTSEAISMGVNIQEDYDSKMTSEQYNQSVIRAIRKQMLVADKDEKIASLKFTHPTFEAYKAHFTTIVNNKKQIVFMYTTIKGKRGDLFIATTDEKHLTTNEKLFDSIFKSMTIK
ncbi:MAG: hypothetical protein JWO09_2099 [Bacteroidetes bacterium]|nr:hypothetical protein [Bacteroidota bacterium]